MYKEEVWINDKLYAFRWHEGNIMEDHKHRREPYYDKPNKQHFFCHHLLNNRVIVEYTDEIIIKYIKDKPKKIKYSCSEYCDINHKWWITAKIHGLWVRFCYLRDLEK